MKEGRDSTASQDLGVTADFSGASHVLSPFGAFRVARQIASGRSSEVVLAVDERPGRNGRNVVLKRPLPGAGGPSAARRLTREARLLHAVAHDNVVVAQGVGRVEKVPYLCLEYVRGVDLQCLMDRIEREHRPFPQAATVYVARCVANALMAVHSARAQDGRPLDIVHGDVSPSNILLSLNGDVKLADFGTARALADWDGTAEQKESSSRVARSVPPGKLGYLAPEQVRGEGVDYRADLFALGVILSELLFGRRMFAGKNRPSVLLAARDGDVEPLWRARSSWAAPLCHICMRSLQSDPAERQAGAAELSAELCGLSDEEQGRRELAQWVGRASNGGFVPSSQHDASRVSGERRANGSESELLPYTGLTSEVTTQLYEPGVPDFTADVSEVSMPQIFSRMRERMETGLLLIRRQRPSGGHERLEATLVGGRVQRVTKHGTLESVLSLLAAKGQIGEASLAAARTEQETQGGDLLTLLMTRPEVDGAGLIRLLRNRARDRLAMTCAWQSGTVMLYRNHKTPAPAERLQLDLAVPLLVGALGLVLRGDEPLPLAQDAILVCGPHRPVRSDEEATGIPKVLLAVVSQVMHPITLRALLELLTERGESRFVANEVRAGLAVALQLGWAQVLAPA